MLQFALVAAFSYELYKRWKQPNAAPALDAVWDQEVHWENRPNLNEMSQTPSLLVEQDSILGLQVLPQTPSQSEMPVLSVQSMIDLVEKAQDTQESPHTSNDFSNTILREPSEQSECKETTQVSTTPTEDSSNEHKRKKKSTSTNKKQTKVKASTKPKPSVSVKPTNNKRPKAKKKPDLSAIRPDPRWQSLVCDLRVHHPAHFLPDDVLYDLIGTLDPVKTVDPKKKSIFSFFSK